MDLTVRGSLKLCDHLVYSHFLQPCHKQSFYRQRGESFQLLNQADKYHMYQVLGNRGSCPEIPLRWRMDTDHFQHSGFLYRRLVHKQLLLYEYSGHEMR